MGTKVVDSESSGIERHPSRKLSGVVTIPPMEGVYSQLTSPASSSFCVSAMDAKGAAG
jgi:hypothetical protein